MASTKGDKKRNLMGVSIDATDALGHLGVRDAVKFGQGLWAPFLIRVQVTVHLANIIFAL